MTLLDDLFAALFGSVLPDHPAVVYGVPTVVLAGWLAVTAEPIPLPALAVGALLSVGLFLSYEYTGLQQESTAGGRSTADWVALGAVVLVVAGVVVVGEVDAISVGVSATQILGGLTGLLGGASVVEWILPTLRGRID